MVAIPASGYLSCNSYCSCGSYPRPRLSQLQQLLLAVVAIPAELFEFEIRTALWATAENKIFFEDARDLKLGWYRPSLGLFIYIDVLVFTVPLKDMASF